MLETSDLNCGQVFQINSAPLCKSIISTAFYRSEKLINFEDYKQKEGLFFSDFRQMSNYLSLSLDSALLYKDPGFSGA
jgi:hypothetical protein